MRFVLKQPAKRTFLSQAQITKDSAELSGQIVEFVINEIKRRYEKENVCAGDGMQVAVMAVSLAEGNLTVEGVKAGLPLDKLRELHDSLVRGILKTVR